MADLPETSVDAPVAPAAVAAVAVTAAPKPVRRKPAAKAKVAAPKVEVVAPAPVEAPVVKAAPKVPAPKIAKPKIVAPKIGSPKIVKAAKPAKTALKPEPKAPAATQTAKPKDTVMTTAAEFATTVKTTLSGLQDKATVAAKSAYAKGAATVSEVNDFSKGNVEALVESGKILSTGLKGLTEELVTESRTAFETLTAEVKELASAKTPTDFFKLHSDLLRKQFDTAVAFSSKQSEALIKLAGEASAPVSTRVSLAVEKIKAAA